MAKQFEHLEPQHIAFIEKQSMYFVATAAHDGMVNLSPKGLDSFRIIDESKIIWLNLTGSGNETAAHLLENDRMTVMFCSFDQQPLILRLYGQAVTVHPRDSQWKELIEQFPEYIGARQIFELEISMVQTSCGFGVPLYQLKGERSTLITSDERRGKAGVEQYWIDKNILSIDGKETRILGDNPN